MAALSDDSNELMPERAKELVESGQAQLIDVREPYEWGAGRIAGAIHIELAQLSSQADTIEKDRPVIFQCRLGVRSAMAMEAFRANGYDAYNLAGGIKAWVEAGLPIEPDDGTVADHPRVAG